MGANAIKFTYLETMEHFKNLLEQLAPIETEALSAIVNASTHKRFEKGDFFASPSSVCQHIGFLESGIFRVYHLSTKKEVTNYFNTANRNPFVSSFKSFLTNEPDNIYVEAITDASVHMISRDKLEELYKTYPSMERIGRLLAEKNYLLSLERIESLQYHTATQRYETFLKQYPMLINQVPHHFIASYLGVTPESLSRIRKSYIQSL